MAPVPTAASSTGSSGSSASAAAAMFSDPRSAAVGVGLILWAPAAGWEG